MSKDEYGLLIDLTCVIGWLMVMFPAIFYLTRAWAARRDALFDLMTEAALERYYAQFFPSRNIAPGARVRTFQKDFGRWYGRRWYIVPLLLLGVLFAFGAWGVDGTLKVWVGAADATHTFAISDVALSAFLGGFAWVVKDQLDRFRSRDFTSHDVYNCVYRLLLAVPLGYSIGAFCTEGLRVPVAFFLGAFPTATLFTIARRLGSQRLGLGDSGDIGTPELEKLQDIGKTNAERFADEGISTIAELAWADPIDLTTRTNRPFNYVVDCISQALLWIYFQDDVQKLYVLSLRGAQEIDFFMRQLESADSAVQTVARKTLATAASKLGVGEDELRLTFRQVTEDPYTKFLIAIWS
jgi:hypothetical protein